tara:strand:+ start:1226 stop:1960 length:735 start_codon:yes stop_codon:yes gene_type:complete
MSKRLRTSSDSSDTYQKEKRLKSVKLIIIKYVGVETNDDDDDDFVGVETKEDEDDNIFWELNVPTEQFDVNIFGSTIVDIWCEGEEREEGCEILVSDVQNVVDVIKSIKSVIEYLKYHMTYGAMKKIRKPTPRNKSISDVTSVWDAEYISKFVNEEKGIKPLWDLINVANFLGVEPLISLATLKAAKAVEDAVIKDKEASSLSSSTSSSSSSLTNVQQLQLQPTSHITKEQVLQEFSWIEDRIL